MLVRDLEFQGVQDQLDRNVIATTLLVKHQECLFRPLAVNNVGATTCRKDTSSDFLDRLTSLVVPTLGGNRLILLDAQRSVVFDSGALDTTGIVIPVTASNRAANVAEAQTTLGGQTFFAAAVRIQPGRDPIVASFVVVAQPQSLVASTAAGALAGRLLEAGGAALVVAILLILLVNRSLTGPLTQL
ncbi:MAG: hypothetical protein ACREOM_08060, partial [Candidatus Dormibacteraceae bacterium]